MERLRTLVLGIFAAASLAAHAQGQTCEEACDTAWWQCRSSSQCGEKIGCEPCDSEYQNCLQSCQIPQVETGTIRPKYYILTVIYAPPGTQGGGSTSSVSYTTGSSMGSATSVTRSFREGYSVSATVKYLISEVGGGFGYVNSQSRNDVLEIRKNSSTVLSVRGPAVDGIDHDRDEIWLWLNPTLDLALTPTSAAWTFGSVTADIQYVYVGWLRDPSIMPVGVAQRLEAYGITAADYPDILSANPFALGATAIDAGRFKMLNTTFPYEPPYAPGDPVPTFQFNVSYVNSGSSISTTQRDTSVRATYSGGPDFLGLLGVSLREERTLTWTSIRAHTSSTSATETASVTVGGPSFGYTGPTDLAVYYDDLYKTFMFAPVEGTLFSVRGLLASRSGRSVAGQEVVMVANGVRYRTFTNARGEYRFPGKITGPVRLEVGRVKQLVQPGEEATLLVP